MHKKLIKHFYSQNHHDMHGDMIVQIIDHCVQTIKKSEKVFLEAQIKNTLHKRFKSKTNYLTRSYLPFAIISFLFADNCIR